MEEEIELYRVLAVERFKNGNGDGQQGTEISKGAGQFQSIEPVTVTHLVPSSPSFYANLPCCYTINPSREYPDIFSRTDKEKFRLYSKPDKQCSITYFILIMNRNTA